MVGYLAGGVPYFAPVGELVYDAEEDRVQCHLCGGWFRLVAGPRGLRSASLPRWRSLGVLHPELLPELHPSRNGERANHDLLGR